MNTFDVAQTYKEMAVKTANSENIIIMLYEKAIQNLDEAIVILKRDGFRSYDQVNTKITKTQAIISELAASLDKKVAPKLCDDLLGLYLFFNRELSAANFEKNEKKIESVKKMLADLLESWNEAVKISNKEKTQTNANQPRRGLNVKG